MCREILTLNAYYLIHHTKSESDLFLFTRNLSNERLKPVFEFVFSNVVNSQRLFCSHKAGAKYSY